MRDAVNEKLSISHRKKKNEKKPKFWRESIMSLLFQLQVVALSHISTLLPFQFFHAWFWRTWNPSFTFFSLFPLLRWEVPNKFQNISKHACCLVLVYAHFVLPTRGCLIFLHLTCTGKPRWMSLEPMQQPSSVLDQLSGETIRLPRNSWRNTCQGWPGGKLFRPAGGTLSSHNNKQMHFYGTFRQKIKRDHPLPKKKKKKDREGLGRM